MIVLACPPGNVFQDGIRVIPVPFRGVFRKPVVTGRRAWVPAGGWIVFTVDEANLTLINSTEFPHILHPGFVARRPVARGHSVYIQTIGEGTGFFPRSNVWAGPHIFNRLDARIRQRFMGGD